MASQYPLKSLVGNSVLGTINWDSEERKGKEAKIMLWSLRPAGSTGWGQREGDPEVTHCMV